jgi:hypothetical protein
MQNTCTTVMAVPSTTDRLPHATIVTSVSCRPASSCYDSHQCLLQTLLLHAMAVVGISCRPFSSPVSPAYPLLCAMAVAGISCRPLASCHGSHQDPPSYASVCFILTTVWPLVMCEHFKGVCLLWHVGTITLVTVCRWQPQHLPVAVTVHDNAEVTHLNTLAGDILQKVMTAANTLTKTNAFRITFCLFQYW